MDKYRNKALSVQERAENLTDQMTTQEQAEQLKYDAPGVDRLGVPAYNWWSEGLHGVARAGVATMFPQSIGLAAMFDDEALYRVADITSTEARAKYNEFVKHGDYDIFKGLTLWSPNVNIFRDPRWGRGQETYGEDPYLTSKLGVAFTNGIQGDDDVLKAAACAKHFAVHSGPEATRHEFNAEVSVKDMEETYFPAFKALVKEAKIESVMGAYNRVNGEAACANSFLMKKLEEWGFDGYFVSDCWAIRDFHLNHRITKTAPESAALALKAGCDLNCGNTYLHILIALQEGLISENDIRKACVHLMKTRIRLGMFDAETKFDKIPYTVVACDEHKAVSLECAEKSMVLLKNDGLLPINTKAVRTIGVIGPNANSRSALEGNYSGTADRYITFLEGIQDSFDGRVLYAEGCHLYKDRTLSLAMPDNRISEAESVAEQSDIVILCLGLDATIEGEEGDTGNEFSSGDKKDLRLPESQRKLLKKISEKGKPIIIVTTCGSSINVESESNAWIHTWYPGQFGGKALANIILGDVSPSGKLPVTFYEKADKLPDFSDYSMKNRTYRYAKDNVLFPFGYGLTYSKTKCTELSYNDGIARLTIKNIGEKDTDDVVQFYIKDTSLNAVPNYSLCGFKRVHLKSGEETAVSVNIERSAFESVDDNGNRCITGSHFTLFAGTSQPDELSEKLMGEKCLSITVEP